MTLFTNAIFPYKSRRVRLLHSSPKDNRAYIYDLESDCAMPEKVEFTDLAGCVAEKAAAGRERRLTGEMKARRDAAFNRLEPILQNEVALFDRAERSQIIKAHAAAGNHCERQLWRDLRRWWQRGRTREALAPDYHRCGQTQTKLTARRGRMPKADYQIYQLTEHDLDCMDRSIREHYFSAEHKSLPFTYQKLLEKFYIYEDGNGDAYLKPAGERPTERQLRHFFQKKYPTEQVIRARQGGSSFERDHRSKLGDVIADCLGVAHRYDIDATIADCFVVSEESVLKIIGKPTLYFIVDRVSRLVTGFYAGLENASWMGAVEAIVSIAEDKAALCERYGVEYDPDDWPADGIFPVEFIGDRAEMLSKASSQISGNLRITIGNVAALRPDLKSIVEGRIKMIQATIRDDTPGYDPPENFRKRRGKKYDLDACLTLKAFGALILRAIIKYNRMPLKEYPRTPGHIDRCVEKSPIALWNDGIRESTGLPTQIDPETVRRALWPREQAVCRGDGILFRGCFYSADHPIVRNWLILARNKGRLTIEVAFDRRLVDAIYLLPPGAAVEPILAQLTTRSEMYRGYSFAEVKCWQHQSDLDALDDNQKRLQCAADYHRDTAPMLEDARARLAAHGKISRDSRRKSIKPDREAERRRERQEIAGSRMMPAGPDQLDRPAAAASNVIGLPLRDPAPTGSQTTFDTPLTPAQAARKAMLS
jgi:putative transposase